MSNRLIDKDLSKEYYRLACQTMRIIACQINPNPGDVERLAYVFGKTQTSLLKTTPSFEHSKRFARHFVGVYEARRKQFRIMIVSRKGVQHVPALR